MSDCYQLLQVFERHLHHLEQGQQHYSRRYLTAQLGEATVVEDWLEAHLKSSDLPLARQEKWPIAMRLQWQAWVDFYKGHYAQAEKRFLSAWQEEDKFGFDADIALGLGKVYTRTGHWHAARAWILCCLQLARKQNHVFQISKSYGALGELMLRAGAPQQALSCMNTAHNILPAGSGQKTKQYNYIASTLTRLKEWVRAESLLMSSLHLATDQLQNTHNINQQHRDSVHHAMARLQFLEWSQHAEKAKDSRESLSNLLPQSILEESILPIANSYIHIALAFKSAALGEKQACIEYLCVASEGLKACYPTEKYWVQRMLNQLAPMQFDWVDAPDYLNLHATLPLAKHDMVDQLWQETVIPLHNGFEPLTDPEAGFIQLSECWMLFFI